MVRGVGTDLVQISRIESSLSRYGEKFARRILSEQEFNRFECEDNKANFLAKRFAVKEAVSKALGTGISHGVHWHTMVISHNDFGAPQVSLNGGALSRLEAIGASSVMISISDDAGLVSAFAVIS